MPTDDTFIVRVLVNIEEMNFLSVRYSPINLQQRKTIGADGKRIAAYSSSKAWTKGGREIKFYIIYYGLRELNRPESRRETCSGTYRTALRILPKKNRRSSAFLSRA